MLRDLFSLFPAYAGVIPPLIVPDTAVGPFPRICGGDPVYDGTTKQLKGFSPHMRG